MASLVLKMSVSLDGFVAPIDGSADSVAAGRSEDGASWTVETLSNAGAHLIGATTYAGWAGYWPGASGPFAGPMNEIPKVVLRTRSRPRTGARRRSPPETWPKPSRGSSRSAQTVTCSLTAGYGSPDRWSRTGLIDEYRLVIHPVVLGAGERLFMAPLTIEPMSTIAFSGGAVAHIFAAHP